MTEDCPAGVTATKPQPDLEELLDSPELPDASEPSADAEPSTAPTSPEPPESSDPGESTVPVDTPGAVKTPEPDDSPEPDVEPAVEPAVEPGDEPDVQEAPEPEVLREEEIPDSPEPDDEPDDDADDFYLDDAFDPYLFESGYSPVEDYSEDQYPQHQYPGNQYPGNQYPEAQNPEDQYPGRSGDTYPQAPVGQARRPAWGPRHWLILGACALLGTVIGTAGFQITNSPPPVSRLAVPATAAPSTTSATPISTQVVPVAPSGTSFTFKEGAWRSQTYSDARFGNLKKGIGLLLDLKTARPITGVTFLAQTGPMTVELRAGDTAATTGESFQKVGQPVTANGFTTLPATTGGSHRYWMIWVTQLPPGFQARIADPVARA
ncbi:MAG: hypothetical protein QG622_1488 [Actinomycetota bacterium]|nr:hypothetical protein [Actinomycetota bacterium]